MEGDKENIEGEKCVFGREVKGEMPKKHYLFSQHCRMLVDLLLIFTFHDWRLCLSFVLYETGCRSWLHMQEKDACWLCVKGF